MGTTGIGINQDDTVADIVGHMVDGLKSGLTLDQASDQVLAKFSDLESDPDEAPLLWLALASVQWKYGQVADAVLQRLRADIEAGHGMERWAEDSRLLQKRKAVLRAFLAKVQGPNPRPSPMPRTVVRKAPYAAGDALSVRTSDGRYTAALVLAVNNTNPEAGMNLVAGLDYLSSEPPGLELFQRRPWLVMRHGHWQSEHDLRWYLPVGHKTQRHRIEVVGNIPLRRLDPQHSRLHCGWNLLGTQVLLCHAPGQAKAGGLWAAIRRRLG